VGRHSEYSIYTVWWCAGPQEEAQGVPVNPLNPLCVYVSPRLAPWAWTGLPSVSRGIVPGLITQPCLGFGRIVVSENYRGTIMFVNLV
jgi:hypothetical protein